MKKITLAATILFAPVVAFAAGGDSSTPPTGTETTQECSNGMVWDAKAGACVAPKNSGLDDDLLYQAVRELAYDGQIDHAIAALDAMEGQQDDRVLTYRGFTARKLGRVDEAMGWYRQALDQNPDNLLARSYMGQGLLEQGDLLGARAQLLEIRSRGGSGSWAETALLSAIETGTTYAF